VHAAEKLEVPMKRALFLALLTLTACGADGTPTAPVQPGVTVTGEAQMGVVVNPNYVEGQ
jgi:hypothetical protein